MSEAMLAIRRRLAGRRITVGEDKTYDTTDHVRGCEPLMSRRT